ncbi:unnamed protein product [Amoebophrya sp. A120]|nr:unnamed protein product [Amoebophrya sp. A120]|eukprot:GSA120T00021455001.1
MVDPYNVGINAATSSVAPSSVFAPDSRRESTTSLHQVLPGGAPSAAANIRSVSCDPASLQYAASGAAVATNGRLPLLRVPQRLMKVQPITLVTPRRLSADTFQQQTSSGPLNTPRGIMLSGNNASAGMIGGNRRSVSVLSKTADFVQKRNSKQSSQFGSSDAESLSRQGGGTSKEALPSPKKPNPFVVQRFLSGAEVGVGEVDLDSGARLATVAATASSSSIIAGDTKPVLQVTEKRLSKQMVVEDDFPPPTSTVRGGQQGAPTSGQLSDAQLLSTQIAPSASAMWTNERKQKHLPRYTAHTFSSQQKGTTPPVTVNVVEGEGNDEGNHVQPEQETTRLMSHNISQPLLPDCTDVGTNQNLVKGFCGNPPNPQSVAFVAETVALRIEGYDNLPVDAYSEITFQNNTYTNARILTAEPVPIPLFRGEYVRIMIKKRGAGVGGYECYFPVDFVKQNNARLGAGIDTWFAMATYQKTNTPEATFKACVKHGMQMNYPRIRVTTGNFRNALQFYENRVALLETENLQQRERIVKQTTELETLKHEAHHNYLVTGYRSPRRASPDQPSESIRTVDLGTTRNAFTPQSPYVRSKYYDKTGAGGDGARSKNGQYGIRDVDGAGSDEQQAPSSTGVASGLPAPNRKPKAFGFKKPDESNKPSSTTLGIQNKLFPPASKTSEGETEPVPLLSAVEESEQDGEETNTEAPQSASGSASSSEAVVVLPDRRQAVPQSGDEGDVAANEEGNDGPHVIRLEPASSADEAEDVLEADQQHEPEQDGAAMTIATGTAGPGAGGKQPTPSNRFHYYAEAPTAFQEIVQSVSSVPDPKHEVEPSSEEVLPDPDEDVKKNAAVIAGAVVAGEGAADPDVDRHLVSSSSTAAPVAASKPSVTVVKAKSIYTTAAKSLPSSTTSETNPSVTGGKSGAVDLSREEIPIKKAKLRDSLDLPAGLAGEQAAAASLTDPNRVAELLLGNMEKLAAGVEALLQQTSSRSSSTSRASKDHADHALATSAEGLILDDVLQADDHEPKVGAEQKQKASPSVVVSAGTTADICVEQQVEQNVGSSTKLPLEVETRAAQKEKQTDVYRIDEEVVDGKKTVLAEKREQKRTAAQQDHQDDFVFDSAAGSRCSPIKKEPTLAAPETELQLRGVVVEPHEASPQIKIVGEEEFVKLRTEEQKIDSALPDASVSEAELPNTSTQIKMHQEQMIAQQDSPEDVRAAGSAPRDPVIPPETAVVSLPVDEEEDDPLTRTQTAPSPHEEPALPTREQVQVEAENELALIVQQEEAQRRTAFECAIAPPAPPPASTFDVAVPVAKDRSHSLQNPNLPPTRRSDQEVDQQRTQHMLEEYQRLTAREREVESALRRSREGAFSLSSSFLEKVDLQEQREDLSAPVLPPRADPVRIAAPPSTILNGKSSSNSRSTSSSKTSIRNHLGLAPAPPVVRESHFVIASVAPPPLVQLGVQPQPPKLSSPGLLDLEQQKPSPSSIASWPGSTSGGGGPPPPGLLMMNPNSGGSSSFGGPLLPAPPLRHSPIPVPALTPAIPLNVVFSSSNSQNTTSSSVMLAARGAGAGAVASSFPLLQQHQQQIHYDSPVVQQELSPTTALRDWLVNPPCPLLTGFSQDERDGAHFYGDTHIELILRKTAPDSEMNNGSSTFTSQIAMVSPPGTNSKAQLFARLADTSTPLTYEPLEVIVQKVHAMEKLA